jgi:hypothetical protein
MTPLTAGSKDNQGDRKMHVGKMLLLFGLFL